MGFERATLLMSERLKRSMATVGIVGTLPLRCCLVDLGSSEDYYFSAD